MRTVYLAAFLAVFLSFAAKAADIAPTYSDSQNTGEIVWTPITNGDTVQEAEININGNKRAQLYRVLVDGTTTGLDFDLQSGSTSGSLKNIDTDDMPAGLSFTEGTSTYSTLVCLINGDYADISFTSSGTGSATVKLTPVGDCTL